MFPKWNETREMLDCIDVLVDGRFVEEQKQVDLLFVVLPINGSSI